MAIITVIVPLHNEATNLPIFYKALKETWSSLLAKYQLELIFVNDGSTDDSDIVLDRLAKEPGVKVLEFSRNFGKEAATTAGLRVATGSAAIMIDADMQHPPELIPQFVQQWERGADVVIGVRTHNSKEGLVKKIGSAMFYFLIQLMSETTIVRRETDFRLIDREVINAFGRFTERERMTRALIDWLGFKRSLIPFEAAPRASGVAAYSTRKLVNLAVSSFISYSFFPLRLAGYLGVGITFLSGLMGLFMFVEKYMLDDVLSLNFSGPAILAVINLFLVGIILCCLGLIALYIGVIDREVTNRPLYVIKKTHNT